MNARRDILQEADSLINGDRNAQYGEPSQDFKRTGILWSTYLSGVFDRKAAEDGIEVPDAVRWILNELVDPWDVAWMQTLLKSSRSTVSPHKRDHYADAIGYSACGWDCANEEEPCQQNEPSSGLLASGLPSVSCSPS